MIVWSSAPWSARLVPVGLSEYTAVYRAAVEVIHERVGVTAESKRAILEVLHPVGYVVPSTVVTLPRATAEVLGLAAEYIGRHAVASRTTLEAITSFALAHRGFKVPELFVDAVSVAYSADLDLTGSGYLGLVDSDSYGYSLSWEGASPANITETWRVGASISSLTFAAPSGRLIRSFALPIGVGELHLTDLGTTRPPDKPNLGEIQEIMVWNRGLDSAERAYVEAYLQCKWIPVLCDGIPLTPPQQQTITDGLIISSADPGTDLYAELLDDLSNSGPWFEFLGCMGAEMPEDAPPETPFRIDNPAVECPTVTSPCAEFAQTICATGNYYSDPLVAAQEAIGCFFSGFGVVSDAFNPRPLVPSDPNGSWIYTVRRASDSGTTTANMGKRNRAPPPATILISMEELLELHDYCIMFDLTAQDIIDSAGYLGEIPDGMSPSEP